MSNEAKSADARTETHDYAGWLTIGVWVMIGLIGLNLGYKVGHEMGTTAKDGVGWIELLNSFGIVMLENLPTLLIIAALVDFGFFFSRCSQGFVFTEKNTKTLQSGGISLLAAAAASTVITPSLLQWIDGDGRGFILRANDLAVGVGAMGLAILGMALVFRDAVSLKEDNDQIV